MPEPVRTSTDLARSTGSTRRSVLTAAAWSAPAIALAVAAPLAAASPRTTCPSNVRAAVHSNYVNAVDVVGNSSSLFFLGLPFAIDLTGVLPTEYGTTAAAVLTGATLTMTTAGVLTTHTGFVGGSGALPVGQTSAVPGRFWFNNLNFPNGTYSQFSAPTQPRSLSVTVQLRFTPPGGITLECPQTFTWNIRGSVTGAVISGRGFLALSGTPSVA